MRTHVVEFPVAIIILAAVDREFEVEAATDKRIEHICIWRPQTQRRPGQNHGLRREPMYESGPNMTCLWLEQPSAQKEGVNPPTCNGVNPGGGASMCAAVMGAQPAAQYAWFA